MKCMWTVLCERISTDKETNLVSYLTCFEGAVITSVPAKIQKLSLGSTWLNEASCPEILNVRLTRVEPDGSQQVVHTIESIDVKDNLRLNFNLDGMPIKETGLHLFRVEMKKDASWIEVASIPFMVKLKIRDKTELNKEGVVS